MAPVAGLTSPSKPAPSLLEAAGVGPRPPREWPRLVAISVALFLIVWGLWAAVAGFQALAAVRDAEASVRRLEKRVDLDLYLDGALDGDIDAAVVALAKADDKLDALPLRPVRVLPFIGRQVRSADALTESGLELTITVRDTGRSVRSILDDDSDAEVHEQLTMAAMELRAMLATVRAIDLGPSEGLTSRLANGRRELADQIADVEPQLESGSELLVALAALLRGPEDHLLLIANNAEARAGSGMILTTGVLRARDGSIEVTDLGSSFSRNLEEGSVTLTQTYEDHFGFLTPEAEWRNLGVTPRFPETAESALRMWEAATGEVLDGVMLVDPFLLKALLVGTGPLELEDRVVEADTIVDYLLHDQYLSIDVNFTNTERRAEERLVAAAALAEVQNRDLDLAAMVPELLEAAERRHLMLWSPDRERQQVWADTGVDGELQADSLMVSISNRSPSKLDYFVEVRTQITTEVVDGRREVELLMAIDNTVDPDDETVYIAGPADGSRARPGEYIGLVTLNLPGNATRGRFDGVSDLSVSGVDGPTRIIATSVNVLPGTRKWLTARFTLPLGQDTLRIEPSGRADPVRWTVGNQRITDDRRWTVTLRP